MILWLLLVETVVVGTLEVVVVVVTVRLLTVVLGVVDTNDVVYGATNWGVDTVVLVGGTKVVVDTRLLIGAGIGSTQKSLSFNTELVVLVDVTEVVGTVTVFEVVEVEVDGTVEVVVVDVDVAGTLIVLVVDEVDVEVVGTETVLVVDDVDVDVETEVLGTEVVAFTFTDGPLIDGPLMFTFGALISTLGAVILALGSATDGKLIEGLPITPRPNKRPKVTPINPRSPHRIQHGKLQQELFAAGSAVGASFLLTYWGLV